MWTCWILINKVIPAYFARAELLNDEYRLGRSKSLTTYQQYFKRDWAKLASASVSGKDYDTNIKTWTCKCGRQKYNAHHLCKHLVQAVAPPPVKFWQNVQRRRKTPLYRHPDLHPRDIDPSLPGVVEGPMDGSITDGDDHVYAGDHNFLTGEGGWRELVNHGSQKLLGKRDRLPPTARSPLGPIDVNVPADDDAEDDRPSKRAHFSAGSQEYEGLDSDHEEEVISFSSLLIQSLTKNPRQVDEYAEKIKKRAEELQRGAEMMLSQLAHRNKIWMKSVVDRNLGADISAMVEDIRHFERSTRIGNADNLTWARPGDKHSSRRVRNTMGYQVGSTHNSDND
jgi:hypothetical protein